MRIESHQADQNETYYKTNCYETIMRQCVMCGSTKTYPVRKKYWCWHFLNKDPTKSVCGYCRNKLYRAKNPEKQREYDARYCAKYPERRKETLRKRVMFMGKDVRLKFNPRKGVCQECGRSVSKGEIKRTLIHHLKYDTTDPLKHTIELCLSCHFKKHWVSAPVVA